MSNHYLLVDDARRVYFDCGKLLLTGGENPGDRNALQRQPFARWWRLANWGDDPPEKTDRYRLAEPEARAIYSFLVESGWKVRIVSLDDDDFAIIDEEVAREIGCEGYRRVGAISS